MTSSLRVRTLRKARNSGLVDGLWTASSSVGSKAQTVVALSVSAFTGGTNGVAFFVLGVSLAALWLTVVDLGLSTQALRLYASRAAKSKTLVLRPLIWRLPLYPALSAIATIVLYHGDRALLFGLGVGLLAAGMQVSQLMSQVAYGLGQFRPTALRIAIGRMATIPLLLVVRGTAAPEALLVVLGVGELFIGLFQYKAAKTPRGGSWLQIDAQLRLRATWRYGVGGVANTIVNRSDTVLVSLVASAYVIGVYGIGSQVQNAISTLALVPAGALAVYAARASAEKRRQTQLPVVAGAVAGSYIVVALPFAIFPNELVGLVFHGAYVDSLVVRLCLLAGLMSCLGGVATQQLAGLGRARALSSTWILLAVVGISSLTLGAWLLGPVGAALGALVRDLFFVSISWGFVLGAFKRRRRTVLVDPQKI